MRYYLFLTILLFSFAPFISNGQTLTEENKNLIAQNEDQLVLIADSMLNMPIPDDRLEYGFQFAKLLKETLEIEGSIKFPFTKLAKTIHLIQPDDQSFRLFNWLVAPSDYIRRYYGIIQLKSGALIPLMNYAERFEGNLLTSTLDAKHWYGCEYYNIKEVSIGKQKYYTLFGINKDGNFSNKKILDVLSIQDNNAVFGAPIFVVPNENGTRMQTQTRAIWEYSKKAVFTLNYNEEWKMILLDRLRSEINNPLRKDTYIPMGQTDGFRWEKDRWVFMDEAIPILKLQDGGAPLDGVFPGGKKK